MQLTAPAKINLSLQIRDRRDDGFHELETLMTPISLWDEVDITLKAPESGIEFRCDDPSLPVDGNNLVVQAAQLFFQATGRDPGVSIELRKKIPHGAGLGGGSSDAASALIGLNQLCQAGLSHEGLTELALQVGSDVPFFLSKAAAVCRGRGEQITPTKLAKPLSLLLLKPAFGVPTVWAYSRWKDSREMPGVIYDPQKVAGVTLVNDLERPVFEKFVFLAQIKMWLLAQPEVAGALMSGSGSTLFAVLKKTGDGTAVTERAIQELDPVLWSCQCETC